MESRLFVLIMLEEAGNIPDSVVAEDTVDVSTRYLVALENKRINNCLLVFCAW